MAALITNLTVSRIRLVMGGLLVAIALFSWPSSVLAVVRSWGDVDDTSGYWKSSTTFLFNYRGSGGGVPGCFDQRIRIRGTAGQQFMIYYSDGAGGWSTKDEEYQNIPADCCAATNGCVVTARLCSFAELSSDTIQEVGINALGSSIEGLYQSSSGFTLKYEMENISLEPDIIDNRTNPETVVLRGYPEGVSYGISTWNLPFDFRADSNISSVDYPDEFVYFGFEISKGEDVLYTSPVLPYDGSNTFYGDYYAIVWPSKFVFTEFGSDYSVRARSRVFGIDPVTEEAYQWGEWSAPLGFEVVDYAEDEEVDYVGSFLGDSGEDEICGTIADLEYYEGGFDLLGLIESFIPSMVNSFKTFLGFDQCYNIGPILEVKGVLAQKSPFRQSFAVAGSMKRAILETEADDSVISVPFDGFLGNQSDMDLVIYDYEAISGFLNGENDFWETYILPIIIAAYSFGFGWFFYNEAVTFFRR